MGGKKVKVAKIEAVVSTKQPLAVWRWLLASYQSPNQKIKYGSWSLSVLLVLALAYSIFALSFIGKVYPNVWLGDQSLAGLSQTAVTQKVQALVDGSSDLAVTLTTEGHSQKITPKDIAWQVDVNSTAANVYNFGRADNNGWLSFYHLLISPFYHSQIAPAAEFDPKQLEAIVAGYAETASHPAQDASAQLINDKLVTTKEQAGQVVDQAEATAKVVKAMGTFQSSTVALGLKADQPTIVLGDTDTLANQVETLSGTQLSLHWPTGSKKLSRKEIRSLIAFVGVPATDVKAKQTLGADFTTESVQNYLTSISGQTDSPAVEPKLTINNGVLAVANDSRVGSVVDLKASATAILAALKSQATAPVELTMKAQQPVISQANLANLGITTRIGFGETSMGNSPANRRHNIANGVSLLSSALIKPGDEFSTVSTLGAVDNTTGFLPELVIKDNRTVPDFGGGLCQVSTTLFRSVMNAGLKVTERQNHSYRVSYYEPPIGLDATIYLPKPDFKFLNDTPGYILIQGKVVGNKVQFELWGTSDGRTSAISDPVVSNLIDPPEPIYTNTDTLAVGVTTQTDHPHQGATAVAIYTVSRNGQVINKQTFKSVYKALPARFLVGTNASLPPPTP